jgi:hypothetical protein
MNVVPFRPTPRLLAMLQPFYVMATALAAGSSCVDSSAVWSRKVTRDGS